MEANMKVITAIYLNLRPDLRDEWLSGTDQEAEGDESIVSGISIDWQIQRLTL